MNSPLCRPRFPLLHLVLAVTESLPQCFRGSNTRFETTLPPAGGQEQKEETFSAFLFFLDLMR